MSITTYAELKTEISNFLNRDDLASYVDSFIDLAEAKMQRQVKHWRNEKRATVTLDSRYTALPDDFRLPIDLRISGKRALQPVGDSDMQDMRFTNEDTTGIPLYYRIAAGEIEVFPTPDQDYTLELMYHRTLDALSDSNTSNWILQYHPDLYLYGALVPSAPWLKDDERIAVWAALYQSSLDDVNAEGAMAKYGGNLRVRP